ncbi:hypothetical protein F0919_17285 [Taibaiella lutea]|uniref:Carboxypeptidase regulatory-like domain-containing protein n=1 Tax=Taibaiella lutea TaxID=2608001 RepID=A0A5M6CBN4_9BACT|nr:hypothetical protein [Taibaiella lutea]KAA5532537.1 hypothetical protein F0919_17285 [Taibaiella lutea]
MTDTEIFRFAKENKFNFCGSFRESQLDRDLVLPTKQSVFSYKKIAASIVALLSFKFSSGQSLQKPDTKIVSTSQKDLKNNTQNDIIPTEYIISGKVSLSLSNPAELANVIIKIGSEDLIYHTDKNGNYRITLKESQISTYTIISFYHPLLKRETRTIHKTGFPATLDIYLDFAERRLGGAPQF